MAFYRDMAQNTAFTLGVLCPDAFQGNTVLTTSCFPRLNGEITD
jgi:hypothetical protein